jgi:Rhodopirellula transposase DDE domain
LAQRLRKKGFPVSNTTVWRLLKRMGFSMKTSVRKRRGVTRDPAARDAQFRYIASQKEKYLAAGLPIISVDTKKKELIGNFRGNGRAWCKEAPAVSEHGFASEAECVATPYGVYDLTRNRGFVVVGLSHNTPEFAATVIARWWEAEGRVAYPGAGEVLILADGGRRQRESLPGLEVEAARTLLRPVRAEGDGVPLPGGVLEVQPGGVQAVQPDQHQLGGQAAPVARAYARLHPRHDDQHGVDGAGLPG